MILSNHDIRKCLEEKKITIENIFEESFRPSSYLLRLSPKILIEKNKNEIIDTKKTDTETFFTSKTIPEDGLIIEPGGFILASCIEKIAINNNYCGLLNQLSCYARIGISVNFSSNYIAPTFGMNTPSSITFEIKNLSQNRIKIYPNVKFCHLIICKLSSPTDSSYTGIYEGFNEAKPSNFKLRPAK